MPVFRAVPKHFSAVGQEAGHEPRAPVGALRASPDSGGWTRDRVRRSPSRQKSIAAPSQSPGPLRLAGSESIEFQPQAMEARGLRFSWAMLP